MTEPQVFASGIVTASHFEPGETVHTVTDTCPDCQRQHRRNAHLHPFKRELWASTPGAPCPECASKRRKAEERDKAERERRRREERFAEVCPPLYRDTDVSRLPVKAQEIVNGWQYGPKGIILHGATGRGKTRTAYALLHRQVVDEGRTAVAMTSNQFRLTMGRMFEAGGSHVARWIADLAVANCLLLDDLAKGKMTETMESELFGLIEERMAHLRPTFITLNIGGEGLQSLFSADRGEPLLRRLRESCDTHEL